MINGYLSRNQARSEIVEEDIQDPLVFQSLQIANKLEQEAIMNQQQAQNGYKQNQIQDKKASTQYDFLQSNSNHQKKINIVKIKAIECLDQTIMEEDFPNQKKCIHQLDNKDQEIIKSMLALPESVVKSTFKSKFMTDSFDICRQCSQLYNY